MSTALNRYLKMKISLQYFGTIWSALTDSQRQQIIATIERTQALYASVLATPESSQINISQKQIDHAIKLLQERFSQTEDFEATLDANELDINQLIQALKIEMRCEATLEYISRDCQPIADEKAERYYFENLEKFKQPERRKASHILITINDDFEENTPQAALKRMQAISEKVRPDNFGWYATRNSECPTAMNEGQLGLVPQGQLHPELDEQLFRMEVHQISPIVITEVGYHILYCQEIVPEHIVHYHDAKAKIVEKHLQHARNKVQKKWLLQLGIGSGMGAELLN